MVKEGDKAPVFSLPSDAGKEVSLAAKPGEYVVVYFYPRDSTPGCTREAQGFTAAVKKFEKAGARVYGVSKDSVESHCKFRDKFKLKIPLLSDPDLAVHKAYGAWGDKVMYGKKVKGVIRSTFVVTPEGKIGKVFPSVKVDGHVDKVLAAIEELRSS
jgi:peroxiredoxin Q/BCP